MEEPDQAMRIRELELTVSAMRDALELRDQDATERVQRATAEAASETDHFKETIRALRDELESREQTHAAALQEAERLQRAELRELQETIAALRTRLEEDARA